MDKYTIILRDVPPSVRGLVWRLANDYIAIYLLGRKPGVRNGVVYENSWLAYHTAGGTIVVRPA